MYTNRWRERRGRWAAGALLVAMLSACGAIPTVAPDPPSNDVLTALCEQAPAAVSEGLEAPYNLEYQVDTDAAENASQLIGCRSTHDHWLYVDGVNASVGLWFGIYTAKDADPPPQDDYCQTPGVHVKKRAETREVSGRPFCLSWDGEGSGGRQLMTASYLDHGLVISVIWTVSKYDADIEAKDDPVATLALQANGNLFNLVHNSLQP